MKNPMDTSGSPAVEMTQLTPLKRAFLALEDAQVRLRAMELAKREPIAVIGLGCRVPGGGNDPASFWRLMQEGVDAIGPIPAARWDAEAFYDPDPETPGRIATRYGGFLPSIDEFDPGFFNISPREASGMDPQQRLLLEVAWEALEHAGQAPERLERSATGVYIGVAGNDYTYLQFKTQDPDLLDAHFASGMAHSVLTGRLSYVLGLQGPSVTVDTACSSSLVAVHLACNALRSGDCRMALAGGVNLILAPELFIALSHSRMLAPDGRCKTFDAAADGFGRAEGCGVVVLKRLSDAQADGDRILALIRGSAVNQDGPSSSLTAPNGPAQEAVIRGALDNAGLTPCEVGFIEAHGTGTQLGDPLEVNALGAVFAADRDPAQPLIIGSVKTNIGHLEAAAGIAGLIKIVLSLQHHKIPPHLHFDTPSPHIAWGDLPLRVSTKEIDWEPIEGRRIGGVSSFGFSGTNAHVILEEAPPHMSAENRSDHRSCVLALSARDEKALAELGGRFAEAMEGRSDDELADICHTANAGRSHFACRAAVISPTISELRSSLIALSRGEKTKSVCTAQVARRDPPRIAFLFTGQGAQYAGMSEGLYRTSPVFRTVLDRCADLLRPYLERPLLEVLFDAGESRFIDETAYTQPALFAVEFALTELWRSWGIVPNVVMGHSVGEYVAACVAGVLSLEDALRLIAKRGRLMQSLPSGGAMAAIFASEEQVEEAIVRQAAKLSIAAINGPEQTVISGSGTEVETLCRHFVAQSIRCQPLPVSHAFHSQLVDPILDRFEAEADTIGFATPRIRLISNLTGGLADASEVARPSYWRHHLREGVRFNDGLHTLAALRPDLVIEIGPHPSLLAFASSAFGEASPPRLIPSLRRGRPDWEQMLEALAAVYVAGAQVDWRGVGDGASRRIVDLPTYPFQRQRYWFHAKPEAALPGPASGHSTGHPLLGSRLRCALAEVVFEARISADAPGFVRQHRVLDRVVLPATAYLEMLIASARGVLGSDVVCLEDVIIKEAMLLEENGAARAVQTICAPESEGVIPVSINSMGEDADADAWVQHVTAKLHRGERRFSVASVLQQLREQCAEAVAPEEIYAGFARRGIDFGKGFHVLRQLWRGHGQAVGEVVIPEEEARYHIHPLLLDGCLQLTAAALPAEGDGVLYLPIGISRLTLHHEPGARCWSHVTIKSAGDICRADIQIFDANGALAAELHEVQFKRATRDGLQRRGERWLDECLYDVHWRPASLASRADAGRLQDEPRDWLIFADQGGVAASLAARLEARGNRCIIVRPCGTPAGEGARSIDPGSAADYRRLLSESRLPGRCVRGVIHAWSLDAASWDATSAADLSKAEDLGAVSTMLLAQALLGEDPVPRLWIITRGAQQADVLDRKLSPSQAPVWGLGRALAAEHPEFPCVCVDLDPEIDAAEADALIAELDEPGMEIEVAFRGGERRVARLRHKRPIEDDSRVGPSWRLVPELPGTFERFRREPVARAEPGPGEVEIAVEATGLNFRDVLGVLGLYPGDPGLLGGECAGRVSAVGAGVTHVRPGDDVLAVASGSFASHVVTRADFVQPRPAGMSAEEGASFPIAFITAEFCLSHLAAMRAGDCVLIHAAAGGVGMAAVKLAKRAGAEVVATAGSEWKRELLRSMGVTHVLDSRSACFADEIMALTNGRGVDLILNSLSGELIEASFRVLARGGRFVEIGKRGIKDPQWVRSLNRDLRYFIVDWSANDPEVIGGIFARLVGELREGKITSLPRHAFQIEDTERAFRLMAQARHAGKIVVRHARARPASAAIRRDGTYLVTGGLSGLGLATARWLAEEGAGRLVLVGRRDITPAMAASLDELRANGTAVIAKSLDITGEAALDGLLKSIRSEGPPLRGIVHSAGVLDDGVLVQQDRNRFEQVLAPKVRGGWLLDRLTRCDPLDWFVMFSSVASILGSAGQTNYSAANAFLDLLARERSTRGLPGLSINWGAWAEVGMAADRGLTDRLAAQGIGAFTASQGLAALARLLADRAAQVAVLQADWRRFVDRSGRTRQQPFLTELLESAASAPVQGAEPPSAELRDQLNEAPAARRKSMVAAFVRERAVRALGIDLASAIDPQTPLSELGLDSLLAVELRNTLGRAFRANLPATLLFDYSTLEALTDYLWNEVLAGEDIEGAQTKAPEIVRTGSAMLADIAELSDEEVERLLNTKRSRGAQR